MVKQVKACGFYQHKVMGKTYPCIQIVTIREILEANKCLDIPLSLEVLKSAQRKTTGEQLTIPIDNLEAG